MRTPIRSAAACALMSFAAAAQPVADKPPSEQAYAGLALRDTPVGTVVEYPQYGPFHGDMYRSDSVWRGDVIVSISCAGRALRPEGQSDERLSVDAFRALIKSAHPGDELTIVYRRAADAEKHLEDEQPFSDPAGQERSATVRLGSRDQWTGSVGRGLRPGASIDPLPEGEFEARILSVLDRLGVAKAPDGGGALFKYLTGVQEAALDPNSLPAVVSAYRRPLSGPTAEAELAVEVRAMVADSDLRRAVVREALHVLDAPSTVGSQSAADPEDRATAEALMATLRAWPYITDEKAIALTRRSRPIFDSAIAGAAALPDLAGRFDRWARAGARGVVPSEIHDAVTGEILSAEKTELGWAVHGGPGPNGYDMSRIAVVVDDGGDDVYRWPAAAAGDRQIILDRAGDDRYESTTDFAGPGAGVFGCSLVDDASGNDTYTTTSECSLASGLFGLGIVIDRAGDDHYENSGPGAGWAEGAGFYGAGMLVDLGGNDKYHGEAVCQGVGGPRGFGAIVDVRGDDSYASTGPDFKSTSQFENSWHSMSQGMGYGVRSQASGGVGAIYDMEGNDTYDAGEYAQGCGYYFGMGILHDAGGNDRYTGAAFVQAYAAHQGIGMLIEDGGNDSYTARILTGQATAWDQSMAWLIDRAGDDVYASLQEGQGAATHQSMGILIDLAGSDSYGSGGGLQGQPGANIDRPGVGRLFGLSVLMDLGGARDTYSVPGRADGQVTAVGERKENSPDESRLYGVFDDQ